MIIINTIQELKKYKNSWKNIPINNYQQTYENIYSIHKSNPTAKTYLDNNLTITFIKKNDSILECPINIDPIVVKKQDIKIFLEKITKLEQKTLYFPLVYEDSTFYQLFHKDQYHYERLYTSITNYQQIGNHLFEHINQSKKVFFSNRNIKKFESKLIIRESSKEQAKSIIEEIEKHSWKYEKKQDMLSKKEQLVYYTELIKQKVAKLIVAYDKENDLPVAYRIDARYNNKVHVLKNSFNEAYKKYSPGSYLLIYDLYKRYKDLEYVDLYGGPGLAKQMIETSQVKRYDIFFGNLKGIEELEVNRKKWDEKNLKVFESGKSIKEVFHKKENILVATSCFGLGPVGKLNAIMESAIDKYNWYASGEEFDINIFSKNPFLDTCFTLEKDQIKEFVNKYQIKYAIVVLKNKMTRILKEIGLKVVYVDSLPFMWSNQDAEEGKVPYEVDVYCAQKTLELSNQSKQIFDKVKNLVWIHPIINQHKKRIQYPIKNFLLINIGGLHSPNTDGLNYVRAVLKPILEIYKEKKIIITTSSTTKKLLEQELKEYKNVRIENLPQEVFLNTIKQSNLFMTSPGLTTILEGSQQKKKVIFLPPQNISQFYNVEYGKTIYSKYKELTWNDERLSLKGLSNKLDNSEKEVIMEINKIIEEYTYPEKNYQLKQYMESQLRKPYHQNQRKENIQYNGANEVIEELEKIIKHSQ